MFKILQARRQQYMNHELPDVQVGFRKGRGTRDQIANILWIIRKRVPYPFVCWCGRRRGWDVSREQHQLLGSTRIPSLPLALFIVMLPKAHLTSHSRMSGSRWVVTPSWLSGSWRYFLYSSVYSCHLFWISSASVRSYHFCLLLSPSLHEMFPWYL